MYTHLIHLINLFCIKLEIKIIYYYFIYLFVAGAWKVLIKIREESKISVSNAFWNTLFIKGKRFSVYFYFYILRLLHCKNCIWRNFIVKFVYLKIRYCLSSFLYCWRIGLFIYGMLIGFTHSYYKNVTLRQKSDIWFCMFSKPPRWSSS